MIKEAIILAGGLGTRLRSAVPDLPKCMAPVAGKPFLSYVIGYLKAQGVERFIFSLGYKHEDIENYLKYNHSDIDLISVVEEEPLGTGGAIKKAAELAALEQVLALNGDTLFRVNLPALADFHLYNKADCTLSLKPMKNSDRYGVVETDSHHRIISFKEKKWYAESMINGGVYALNTASFLHEDLPLQFSFEKDYLEAFYTKREMYGYAEDAYFIDIGIPSDLEKAQTELLPYV